MPLDAGEVRRSSARPHTASPVEQAVFTVDFRNARRDGVHIHTSEVRQILDGSGASFYSKLEGRPQRSLFKSILGSHVSRDFSVSSHVTSRPVYAAVRAIMHESADSVPFPASLW